MKINTFFHAGSIVVKSGVSKVNAVGAINEGINQGFGRGVAVVADPTIAILIPPSIKIGGNSP